MKIYLSSISRTIFFVIIAFLQFSCNQKDKLETSTNKNTFNGLYSVRYSSTDVQYVWIFSEGIQYMLYPAQNSNYTNPIKNVGYAAPLYYNSDDEKLFYGNVVNDLNPEPIDKRKFYPVYNIISIDTTDFYDTKFQIIKLEDINTKESVELERRLR